MTYQNARPHTPQGYATKRNSTLLARMFDLGPYILAVFSFLVAVSALVSLIGIDVLAGQVSVEHMSNNQVGWFTSLATTGLIMALMGTVLYGVKEQWNGGILIAVCVVALIPISIDVYFDYLAPDILRFGSFVDLAVTLTGAEQMPHLLFRILIAGISLIGEPLAATSIIIFPVLRELFDGATGS